MAGPGVEITVGLLECLLFWLPFVLGFVRKRARRAAPAFRFQPFSPKQLMLLSWWTAASPYHDWDGVIAEGSIRSGKTVAMIDSFVTWMLATFEEGHDVIVAGRSMAAIRRNVLKPLFQILRAKGIAYHYHRSEHWVQIGPHTLHLFGASNESSQDVLQGLTAAGALFDEVALMPKSFVEQAIGRCSVEGSKLYFNCNPEGPFHWFKTEFIDQARKKRLLRLHFTLDDNLSLSDRIRDRYRRMFSGVWYQRFILGLWVVAEGIIYQMFDEERHVRVVPGSFSRYGVAVDYGTTNPFVVGLFGWNPSEKPSEQRVYLVDLLYYDPKKARRDKTDAQYAKDFQAFTKGVPLSHIVVDPSAKSFIVELRERGYDVRQANNDVLSGIRWTASMLDSDRFLLAAGNDRLRPAIQEFASYAWDEKAQMKGEDRPLKVNDHCLDMVRYFLFTLFYHDTPEEEFAIVT